VLIKKKPSISRSSDGGVMVSWMAGGVNIVVDQKTPPSHIQAIEDGSVMVMGSGGPKKILHFMF